MEQPQGHFFVTEDVLASQSQRFINYIIDVAMLLIVLIIFVNIFVLYIGDEKRVIAYFEDIEKNSIVLYGISFSITLFYYNFFEIIFSRTIGKMITQTVVVDENGEKPDHQVIMIRSLCRLIPFFPFSFFRVPTLGWHDRISKTYVVNKKYMELKKVNNFNTENIKEN